MYIPGIEREVLRKKNKGRTKCELLKLTLKYQNSRYDQFVIFHIIYIYIYIFLHRSNVLIFYTNIVLY